MRRKSGKQQFPFGLDDDNKLSSLAYHRCHPLDHLLVHSAANSWNHYDVIWFSFYESSKRPRETETPFAVFDQLKAELLCRKCGIGHLLVMQPKMPATFASHLHNSRQTPFLVYRESRSAILGMRRSVDATLST